MQTILGANGIIGEELAKELRLHYTNDIRLVGRNPVKVNPEDELFAGDLLKVEDVKAALADTDIAYLTVGLPYKSEIWLSDWPKIMENIIIGCRENNCKLVYFDNTYAYPQDTLHQKETTPLAATGQKGISKKIAVEKLMDAITQNEIEAVICRAPEFYGPGKTKGITNSLLFENIRKDRNPKVFLSDKVKRTLIYTPDASKATALIGNTPACYGETWHLPCDDNRLTYQEFIAEISSQLGRKINYNVLNKLALKAASLVSDNMKETQELLPRYEIDNIFDSSKFKSKFPDFEVTSYQEGIQQIIADYDLK